MTRHVRVFRAPGRVNLMGDHTDYNEGFVLPVAIDLECRVEAAARDDRRVVVRSAEFEGVAEFAADGSTDPRAVAPEWGRLAAAVVGVLASRGRPATGADLKVASNVPVGSGLSSSAAFEVAVATALCGLGGFPLDLVHLALACQEAEQRATGVPCGVMDQLTSAAGVADHALLLDCRSLRFVPVALPSDLVIVVVHSGMARRLTDTPYAERRAACKAAAARLGVPSLRDATVDQVADDPVARHVVTENARVGATAMALAAGDLAAIGQAFAASHASLRDDFGCSTTETDQLVDDLVRAGAVGARLTGAGWGGCVVALATQGTARDVIAAAGKRRNWVCGAVDGASEVLT